jgi:hypothetical protein
MLPSSVLWAYVDLHVVILFCVVGVCGFVCCDLVLYCGCMWIFRV